MAEIEHFVDPDDKSHHKFFTVEDIKLPLFTADNQEKNGPIIHDMPLKAAVESKTIGNQTIAYFMARTYLFLTSNGIHPDGVRFRQHRCNEMAHYAADCWDAEVECSYGWIEVAGHSDRSCFDLTRHAEHTGRELVAARQLKEPVKVKLVRTIVEKQKIGKALKKESQPILKLLEALTEEQKSTYADEMDAKKSITLKVNNKDVELKDDMVRFERYEQTQHEEKYTPHVIEPSFGLGRIMYCIFEHCFRMREED